MLICKLKYNSKYIVLKNKIIFITCFNALCIVLLAIFLLYNVFNTSKKIVYVDSIKLFDSFSMTKEMKRIGEKEFNTRKAIVDTLYSKLQSSTISEVQKKELMPKFIKGKEYLEQFNQTFAINEVPKIWSRINGYAKEYGKENNYQLILSSGNQQSVLFADEKIDITNNLLAYINKKYEGFK